MQIKNYCLLLLLLMAAVVQANNNPVSESTSSINMPDLAGPCDISAPVNFYVLENAPSWVAFTWTPVGILPQTWRIRTYEVSTGLLVNTSDFPGGMNIGRVFGLTPGIDYHVVLNGVCPDGTESLDKVELDFETLILELVVTGLTYPGSIATCGLNATGQYCDFSTTSGQVTTFQIAQKTYPFATRNFGVSKTGSYYSTGLTTNNTNQTYKIRCNDSGEPFPNPCYPTYFSITKDNVIIAKYEMYQPSANGIGRLRCLFINPYYQILRLESGSGFAPGGSSDERDNYEESWSVSDFFTTAPNPFSDHLDISLNITDEKESVSLNLYDLQGRLVISQTTQGGQQTQTLSTETLLPGMYFLRVEAGGKTQAVKVVKTQ